jgi:FixJ family two-component response regulator
MTEGDPVVHVIDDDDSARRSLEALMRSAGLATQSYGTAHEFLKATRGNVPSCLVLDVRLPGLSGLELQRELAAANVDLPIVFLTGYGDIPMTVQAMRAGAIEFLTKPVCGQDLVEAVQRGLEQDRELRREQAEVSELRQRFAGLTARESEVLQLMLEGLLNKQIAERLGTSELTVKTHRAHLMEKTRAESPAQLAHLFEKLNAANRRKGRLAQAREAVESAQRPPDKAGY